jgi:hypothetical protein
VRSRIGGSIDATAGSGNKAGWLSTANLFWFSAVISAQAGMNKHNALKAAQALLPVGGV